MDKNLNLRYDREADILYIDSCPPYSGQESDELNDEVVARLNPDTGEVANIEVLFSPPAASAAKRWSYRSLLPCV